MGTDYDKADCKELHKELNAKFDKLEIKFDKLESRMNYFYLLAVGTLVALVMNLLKGI
jgi:hypothetical protein